MCPWFRRSRPRVIRIFLFFWLNQLQWKLWNPSVRECVRIERNSGKREKGHLDIQTHPVPDLNSSNNSTICVSLLSLLSHLAMIYRMHIIFWWKTQVRIERWNDVANNALHYTLQCLLKSVQHSTCLHTTNVRLVRLLNLFSSLFTFWWPPSFSFLLTSSRTQFFSFFLLHISGPRPLTTAPHRKRESIGERRRIFSRANKYFYHFWPIFAVFKNKLHKNFRKIVKIGQKLWK